MIAIDLTYSVVIVPDVVWNVNIDREFSFFQYRGNQKSRSPHELLVD
jgi:hypothetical protein